MFTFIALNFQPSDGLKSDEKQAKEERARLEQLEKERELRMMGEEEQIAVKSKQTKVKHRYLYLNNVKLLQENRTTGICSGLG